MSLLKTRLDEHRKRSNLTSSPKQNMRFLMQMWQIGNTYDEDKSSIEKQMKELDPNGDIMLEIVNELLDELYEAKGFHPTEETRQKALDSLNAQLKVPKIKNQ